MSSTNMRIDPCCASLTCCLLKDIVAIRLHTFNCMHVCTGTILGSSGYIVAVVHNNCVEYNIIYVHGHQSGSTILHAWSVYNSCSYNVGTVNA